MRSTNFENLVMKIEYWVMILLNQKIPKALFGFLYFLSLNFRYSSLITHHFKYYTRLAPSLNFHHSISFTLFVDPIPRQNQWKKTQKKKEKKPRTNQSKRKKKKKKVKSGQKLRLVTVCGSPMCLITILSLSYELWKLKTAKMCFQFP